MDLPFAQRGQVQGLGDGRCLVSGYGKTGGSAQLGFLCLVKTDKKANRITLVKTWRLPGLQPVFFAWNKTEKALYVYDRISNSLRRRSFSVDDAEIALKGWKAILAPGKVPFPGKGWRRMRPRPDGPGFGVDPVINLNPTAWVFAKDKMYVIEYPRPRFMTPSARMRVVVRAGRYQSTGGTTIDGQSLSKIPAMLELSSPPGIVEMASSKGLLRSVQVPSTGSVKIPVPGWASALPGRWLHVSRKDGKGGRTSLRPLVRYGQPMGTSDMSVNNGILPLTRMFFGSSRFRIPTTIRRVDASADLDLHAYLLVGHRTVEGYDPVTRVGKSLLLRPDRVMIRKLMLAKKEKSLGMTIPMPIPDDAKLMGNVVLFQWVFVAANSQCCVSDIFGSGIMNRVQPARKYALMKAWPERTLAIPDLGTKDRAAHVDRAKAWLVQPVDPGVQRVLSAVQAMLEK